MSRCGDTGADADQDGLADACELAIAHAFAPLLRVHPGDCAVIAGASTLQAGFLFVAQPVAAGVRVAYLPAYARDCGWSGAVCWLRGRGCGGHAGDSELIVVDVAPTAAGEWRPVGVFLSAHCFGGADGRCRWYRGASLAQLAWDSTGAPVVWVARGKHANYPSAGSCDRGHWGFDSCDGNTETIRFPIQTMTQNLGSRAVPGPTADGCLSAAQFPPGSPWRAPQGRECFWDAAQPFRGWQVRHDGAAPSAYGVVLARLAEL